MNIDMLLIKETKEIFLFILFHYVYLYLLIYLLLDWVVFGFVSFQFV